MYFYNIFITRLNGFVIKIKSRNRLGQTWLKSIRSGVEEGLSQLPLTVGSNVDSRIYKIVLQLRAVPQPSQPGLFMHSDH